MGVSVSVTYKNRGAIRRLAQLAPARLAQEVAKSAFRIHAGYKQKVAVSDGMLRASIAVEFEGDGLTAGVGSNSKYAAHVEFGTKPHWPPIAAVQRWADKHGIPAFLVARAISQRGTPAQPALGPAFDAEKRNFQGNCKTALEEVARQVAI